jgi:NAD(P)-dependent dehydrogenase (short-subunit alcohol dehydrogenase family)
LNVLSNNTNSLALRIFWEDILMVGEHSPCKRGRQVAVVVGATSKWQADGRNTRFAHGRTLEVDDLPVGIRWGVGGAVAQKFAQEGYFVVLTTRAEPNARDLAAAIAAQGGECMIVEMDLAAEESIATAFANIRAAAGEPHVVVYNAGSMDGRELPPDMELLENIPVDMFDRVHHIASRGPFLIAKEVLPAMRKAGSGSLFFSNNPMSLRGRKRNTGESLYYPRVMMRALAQVLTEEYSEHGVHVANIVIDGYIDSPGTRALAASKSNRPLPSTRTNLAVLIDPVKIAEAYYYLHTQDRCCWTHEIMLTPYTHTPAH